MDHNDKVCLILGGCGFLGSVIAKRLVKGGWNVRVFDKEGTDDYRLKPVLAQIEMMRGDFMNVGDLHRALDQVSTVLHFIGTTIPQTSMSDIDYDIYTNVLATVRLLELMRNKQIDKFIFSSSGGTVYGVPEQFKPLQEHYRTEPISAYGISKLMIEKYIHLFSVNYQLRYIILRFSNPYGESQSLTRLQGAVGVFLQKALRGEEISIWGDGSVIRDYIYEEDVARAVESLLGSSSLQGIFNVGSGEGTSLNQLLTLIRQTFSIECKVRYLPPRAFDVPYNVLNISKIQTVTGWKPRQSLQEGLQRMGKYLQILTHG